MVFSNERSLIACTSADLFLAELIRQYSVSDKFLKGFIPRVEKIFEHDISAAQRASLLKLAKLSMKRQAETEALLREASIVLDRLTPPPRKDHGHTRRRRPVTTIAIQDETSTNHHISSAS